MSADISFDVGAPLPPGEDPAAFRLRFCDRLAGSGALTTNSPDPNLNRPILPALCRWVRDGWRGLNLGLGIYPGGVPEDEVLAPHPVDPEDAGSLIPLWSPRFPFEGPSPYEWTIDETPWPGAAMGLPNPPPVGDGAGVSSIFEPMVAGRSYWVKLDDQEVYVLVRRAVTPLVDQISCPRLGFDPVDAAVVGMAWKAMREAITHLRPWWNAVAVAGLGLPPIPIINGPAGASPAPLPTFLDGDVPLLPALARRVRGEASTPPFFPGADPVFLWQDPLLTDGDAGSQSGWRAIKFAAGVVRASDAAMHQLGNAGLTNWARLRFPSSAFTPYPVVTPEIAKLAAWQVASIAGTLAHEMLHMTWREDFEYRRGWHSDNFPWCTGPTMDVTNPDLLRSYVFPPSSSVGDQFSTVPLDTAAREIIGQPGRATRHFTNYLLQNVVTGLLRNDPGGRIRHQHENWCGNCADYANQNVCPSP